MSLKTRLDTLDRIAPPAGAVFDYVAVVRLPDGREYLALPGVPTIQVAPPDGHTAETWRPPFRRFRPGRDDRGRRVVTVETEHLADVRIEYQPDGPEVCEHRDTRWPFDPEHDESETSHGWPLSID